MTVLVFAVLTAASCGGSTPTPTSANPPIAKSPTPSPAKTVDTAVNSKGLRENREIDYAKPKGRMRIVSIFSRSAAAVAPSPSCIETTTRLGS